MTKIYKPVMTNITNKSVAATTTDQLSHSMDAVQMWALPNWNMMTWDLAWRMADKTVQEVNASQLKQIQFNSKQNKTFVHKWRNRDPFTRGKYINLEAYTNANLAQSTATEPYWNATEMPHTAQWYSNILGTYQDWSVNTSTNPTLAATSTFPICDPAYAIKNMAWIIAMPGGASGRLTIVETVKTNWSGVKRFIATQAV